MKSLVKVFIILFGTFALVTFNRLYSTIDSYPHAKILETDSIFTGEFLKAVVLNNYISLKDYVMNEFNWRRSDLEDSLHNVSIYIPPKSLVRYEFNQKRNNLVSKFYPVLHKQKYKAYHLNNNLKDTSKIQLRNVGMNGDHYINPKNSSMRIKFGKHSNSYGKKASKNILRRETRKYSFDYFANVIFNQLSGGIKINSDPINFTVNGKSSPLFLMEDGFDKFLIEKNRRREGSIIEVGFNGKLNDYDHDHFKKHTKFYNYNYKSNDTLFTDLFIDEMNKGTISINKIDKEKLNCLILICFDFFGVHPIYDINLHWVHNPVSNLMEPTIREAAIDPKTTINEYINLRPNDFISNYLKQENLDLDSLRNHYYPKFDLEDSKLKMKKWKELYQPDFIKNRIDEIISELNSFKIDISNEDKTLNDSSFKIITFKGSYVIDKDIIIKEDEILDISFLNELIFKNDANLYIYGDIVNLNDQKSIWKVENGFSSIFVKSQKKITIKNIDFYGFSNLLDKKNHHYLPSAITFYKTDILVENCNFYNNIRGDDYINFFECKNVEVNNSQFNDVIADAIDSDFSNFIIKNSSFINIGNDAIDASGSVGKIQNVFFDNIFDKAISGGESSNLNVKNSSIINSEIGLVSKDGCILNFENIRFNNNKLNIAAFTKKMEYPKAQIFSDSKVENFLFERNVITNISKDRVEDVYSLMYGNEYGRKSK
tara:strand:- start:1530 stop:3665 length:2136 start_codon:yes stop_codon:yes gene_type:complete